MHKACIFGQLACVRKLIDIGADLGSSDSDGNTPLHYASRCGFGTVVSFLVNAGADKDANNNDGNSPADVATASAKAEFA